jgi:hypothetical protein
MKGKSLSKPALITLLILAAGLAITLAGCTGAVSLPTGSGSVSLGKAATCKSVDPQTEEAVEPANTFTADTAEIFCSVKLSNAPSGTEVSAEWLYAPEATGGGNDLLIDSWSRVTEGTRHLSTSIAKPATGWPRGAYKVVFYLNGNENQSVAFSVQ